MKLLFGIAVIFGFSLAILAQDSTQSTASDGAVKAAKIVAEIAARQSGIKNSPLSCDEINESVQTLADGNRIVRSSQGKMYRNSEGRVRREISGGIGGMMGSLYTTGQGVSIINPDHGYQYLLDSQLKTARVMELGQGSGVTIVSGARAATAEEKAKVEARLQQGLLKGEARLQSPVIVGGQMGVPGVATTITGQGGGYSLVTGAGKYDVKTEELGSRDFEGVAAEGTRRITTIPAGAIGNERPIEIVYERWYSKELGLVVYSKNSDPRFGEQTYRLTNIVRAEPDPALFSVPTHYKKIGEHSTIFRPFTAKPASPKAPELSSKSRATVQATKP